jgi:hypothetical protein
LTSTRSLQALNRVHRIGQTHSVRCVIFYAHKTFEERLLALRQSQNRLSEVLADSDADALSDSSASQNTVAAQSESAGAAAGAGVGSAGFFSAAHMKLLFGLTDERCVSWNLMLYSSTYFTVSSSSSNFITDFV